LTAGGGGSGQRLEFNSIENKNVLSFNNEDPDGGAAGRRVSFSPSTITPSSDIHVSVDFNPTNEQSWTLIRGVKPATNYYCFMRAENEIGLSPASQRLEIQTDEEGTSLTTCPVLHVLKRIPTSRNPHDGQ